MRQKKPYIATLDQMRISRQGDAGVIEYVEPNVYTTHLQIGPEAQDMSDEQILDVHNQRLLAQEQMAAEYEHIAVGIPPGKPQIKYFAVAQQWVPRGDVLRCEIGDDEEGNVVIYIDDQELSLEEFGRFLRTYAGWGMRIAFVPEDEIHKEPQIEVREPDDE